jgi:hypothetical protein
VEHFAVTLSGALSGDRRGFSATFLTLPTTRAFRTGGAPYKPGSGRAIATKYLTGDITLYPSQIISIEPMDRAFHLQDMMQDAVKLADGRDAVPIHPTSNDHADMTVLEDDLAQVYYIKANLSKLLPIVEQGVFDSRDRGLSSMEKLLLGNGTLLSKVDWESIPREQATGRFNEPAFSDLIY